MKDYRRPCFEPGEPILTTLPNGETVYLYDTGHLAFALGRTYSCIRQWEISGMLPPTPFRGKTVNIRLYTQEQIDAVVMYAEKYRISNSIPLYRNKGFSKACFEAFAALQKKYLGEE